MKYRRWMAAALALVMIFSNVPARTGFAEEIVPEGDEFFPEEFEEEEMDDQDWAVDVGYEDDGQEDPEYSEFEDQEDADFFELIEENDMEVVTVSEGGDYEEIQTAESEADAAAEKVKELMDGVPLLLEVADPERIRTYLDELSAVPSPIGSDGELETASYIEKMMSSFGYTISEQHFHEGFLNEEYTDMPGVSIIAERGANSENRTNEIVLICAHYDSKTKPDENDPLANDKSSAAAVLECARILSTVESNVDLCFLFFSGEEDGYYGSLRLAEGLTEEIRNRIKCVIYVGSVGYRMEEETNEQEQEALSEAWTESEGTEKETVPDQNEEELIDGLTFTATDYEEVPEAESKLVPPVLIAAPTDQSNDPADLLKALGLYLKAEEMLTGDFFPAEETTEVQILDGTEASTEQPQGTIGAALAESAEETIPAETIPAMSYEGMEEDWTLVTGDIGFLQNFTENGMIVAGLFQPVSDELMQEAHVRPLSGDGTAPETENGGQNGAAGVSDSLGAQNVSDILLAAGSKETELLTETGTQETSEQPRIIPVQDEEELADFVDYLASAVSLYMRSRTSIVL